MKIRFKMNNLGKLLSTLCIGLILCSSCLADKSTIERIRKHQEWLKQRKSGLNNAYSLNANDFRKSIELANLWRFDKKHQQQEDFQSSINEVYPENEILERPSQSNSGTVAKTTTKTTATTQEKPIQITTISTTKTTTTTTTPKPTKSVIFGSIPTTTATVTTNSVTSIRKPILSNDILYFVPKTASTTTTTTQAPPTSTTIASTSTTSTSTLATTMTTTTSTRKPKPKMRPYPRWGNWSKWSECSRSCDGGVMYQQRKCINRNSSTGKHYVSKDCIGVYKRYQLCNDQACPLALKDFRAEQCSAFNDVDFQGQKYNWEPYIRDDAECELNCKPVGMKYFATLNSSVIDGTPCEKPAEFYRSNYKGRAMCVEGICKAITTGGLITGLSANSGAVSCGGILCRPITGIFTRDPLPEDAYIHVSTIPAGSSNISITELKNSINLLVLRTSDQKYVFNGDNLQSDSGSYEAAGAIFDYHRIDGLQQGEGVTEWITCMGPINDNLELMIYSKTMNPGIKYEYLLPITSDSEENEVSLESDGFLKAANDDNSLSASRTSKRRRYNWKVVGFSSCSKSCGGGTQTPIVRCVRENPLRYYSQRRCMHSDKPVINENLLRCNTQPCPAYWRLDEWSSCRCHQAEGFMEREISCVQELASGIVIHVDTSACMEEKPSLRKPCDCPKNRRRSHSRLRMHGLTANSTHLKPKEKAGNWLMSDWNQYCSADCGSGMEYRTIYCDRSKPNTDRCDIFSTPSAIRPCELEKPCDTGDWFLGPWSPCNGNCFNLTRTRQVLCIQNQLIVDDEDCRGDVKPLSVEKCSHEEVEYCGPRWHYSEWSECTKTCDGGTQRRTVKCLEYDDQQGALKESNKCRYSLREPIYRSCNTHKCEESLQNDGTMSCADEFGNCQLAVRAKLCSYEYYKKNCCFSCSIAG